MLIKTLPVGDLETNCYVVTNEKTLECVVIDPGDESNTILDYLESNHLTCKAIFLTHGHYDHVGAVEAVQEETGATVYMNAKDDAKNMHSFHFPFTLPENGRTYDDGDVVSAAGIDFSILSTPGHTPGSVVIRAEDALFTGDTLFRGSCGRTDLDGGSMEEMLQSLRKICSLEGDYEVYPGHMDCSSLIRERSFNYYCRAAMQK
ncbi:MAG: MBL fold metallo-hydrolase [Oscillospiraceae bacterium]|jgi:glyoxylase-like metal-dependent hydrolase (beta-lactamase superfamily II)|nr:MBL fold metallo-hydrolase [Oscillospiraceae bacterium]